MTTARDHVVTDFDRQPLLERAATFRDSSDSDAEVCRRLGIPEKKGWNIRRARELIQGERSLGEHIRPVLYRPFDTRFIFYHDSLVWRTVKQIMGHMLPGGNVGLCTTRSVEIGSGFEHVFCSQYMIQHHTVSLKEVNYIFPLYLYRSADEPKRRQSQLEIETSARGPDPDRRRPNLNPAFVADLEKRLGLKFVPEGAVVGRGGLGPPAGARRAPLPNTFGPEDVFNYMYAVFHSPTYRTRYAEFLKSDFPRVPLTSDVNLFRALCEKGAELVALHLLESPTLENPITGYPVQGSNVVEKGFPKYVAPGEPEPGTGKPLKAGRVYINSVAAMSSSPSSPKSPVRTPAQSAAGTPPLQGQYFEGVPPEVWNFHIGGYQVCEKWLKDRRGRTLSFDDLTHYQKIITALKETIRLMGEIDSAIPQWPIE